MKTIEELALEINKGLNRPLRYDHDAIDFATKLIAAWQAQQEPVGVFADVNRGNDREPQWEQMIPESFDGVDYVHLYLAPPPPVPDGYVLVPKEILDSFPEINPSNYDHGNVCTLNAWGVELVLATQGQSPLQGEQK